MKTYTIKNSDIMHNGKLFPEGSTINLDDKDAESLSNYLVTLSASSRGARPDLSGETRDEASSINNKEQNTKNKSRSK